MMPSPRSGRPRGDGRWSGCAIGWRWMRRVPLSSANSPGSQRIRWAGSRHWLPYLATPLGAHTHDSCLTTALLQIRDARCDLWTTKSWRTWRSGTVRSMTLFTCFWGWAPSRCMMRLPSSGSRPSRRDYPCATSPGRLALWHCRQPSGTAYFGTTCRGRGAAEQRPPLYSTSSTSGGSSKIWMTSVVSSTSRCHHTAPQRERFHPFHVR
mmetsp:Transcript_6698/g.17255  ORF Transcript_6698/g.17255 Transcript_6698/m.17255 type:complete len:209 (-) Transcript_6698:198-824(-)